MTITSTQLKQETYLIDNAIKEDILVTKRGRPFVVIMDVKRYEELIDNQKTKESKNPRVGWDEKFKDTNVTEHLKSSKKNKGRLDEAIEQIESKDYIIKDIDLDVSKEKQCQD